MSSWNSDELNAFHAGVMEAASQAATDGTDWEIVQQASRDAGSAQSTGYVDAASASPSGSAGAVAATKQVRFNVGYLWLFGGLAAVAVLAIFLLKSQLNRNQAAADEGRTYQAAAGDARRLREYISSCTVCEHKNEARLQLDKLKNEALTREDHDQYRAAIGSAPLLRSYLANCKTCDFTGPARTEIEKLERSDLARQEEQRYRIGRGNVSSLKAYVTSCKICTFSSAAQTEIDALERAALARHEDEQTYRNARGDLNLLRAYVRDCSVCSFATAARTEIVQLERDAKYVNLEICNRTSYRASIAASARKNADASDWTVEGWWTVNPGACSMIGRYAKGYVYVLATVYGGSKGWRGKDAKICVTLPGPFERFNQAGYTCRANERLESFRMFLVNDNSFTWTLAEEPRESDDLFVFEVCNSSSFWAAVAVSGVEVPNSGVWIVQGWSRVAPGACQDIGKFARGTFYAMAEHLNDPSSGWRGYDIKLCVQYPGPFKRINRGGEVCNYNELQSFRRFTVTQDRYRWTLLP